MKEYVSLLTLIVIWLSLAIANIIYRMLKDIHFILFVALVTSIT